MLRQIYSQFCLSKGANNWQVKNSIVATFVVKQPWMLIDMD